MVLNLQYLVLSECFINYFSIIHDINLDASICEKHKAMHLIATMAEEWLFHASYNVRAKIGEFSGLYSSSESVCLICCLAG